MKKITPDELKGIRLRLRGNLSPIRYELMDMQQGETLLIEPSDWNRKTPPSVLLRELMKKYRRTYTVATMLDKPGWLVTRIN